MMRSEVRQSALEDVGEGPRDLSFEPGAFHRFDEPGLPDNPGLSFHHVLGGFSKQLVQVVHAHHLRSNCTETYEARLGSKPPGKKKAPAGELGPKSRRTEGAGGRDARLSGFGTGAMKR
jgi:hypothetical protein